MKGVLVGFEATKLVQMFRVAGNYLVLEEVIANKFAYFSL
jgi:hypothetical protein